LRTEALELRIHLLDTFDRRELSQLLQEFLLSNRLERILVLQLSCEELKKLIPSKFSCKAGAGHSEDSFPA
jgi:hypothetical protein